MALAGGGQLGKPAASATTTVGLGTSCMGVASAVSSATLSSAAPPRTLAASAAAAAASDACSANALDSRALATEALLSAFAPAAAAAVAWAAAIARAEAAFFSASSRWLFKEAMPSSVFSRQALTSNSSRPSGGPREAAPPRSAHPTPYGQGPWEPKRRPSARTSEPGDPTAQRLRRSLWAREVRHLASVRRSSTVSATIVAPVCRRQAAAHRMRSLRAPRSDPCTPPGPVSVATVATQQSRSLDCRRSAAEVACGNLLRRNGGQQLAIARFGGHCRACAVCRQRSVRDCFGGNFVRGAAIHLCGDGGRSPPTPKTPKCGVATSPPWLAASSKAVR